MDQEEVERYVQMFSPHAGQRGDAAFGSACPHSGQVAESAFEGRNTRLTIAMITNVKSRRTMSFRKERLQCESRID